MAVTPSFRVERLMAGLHSKLESYHNSGRLRCSRWLTLPTTFNTCYLASLSWFIVLLTLSRQFEQ